MPTKLSVDIANQLFLAYTGRPADYAWQQSTANLLNDGAPSVALQNAFYSAAVIDGTFSLSDSPSALVNKIFLNLGLNAGKGASTFEQAAWADLIAKGAMTAQTAAWTIFTSYLGATNFDDATKAAYQTPVQSKLVALNAYTAELANNSAANLAISQLGSSAANSAKTFIAGILTQAGAATAVTGIASTVSGVSTSTTGSSFLLTTSPDNVTGTSANDSFSGLISSSNAAAAADLGTLNSADSLNGGSGTDTLTVRVAGLGGGTGGDLSVSPALTSIETVLVSNGDTAGNRATLNLGSATGVTTVGFKDGVTGATKTTILSAPSTASVSLDNADGSGANAMRVNVLGASSRTGTADALSLSIANGSGSSTAAAVLDFVAADGTSADGTFEVANVTVSGAASYVNLSTGSANIRTVKATGATTADTSGYGLTLTEGATFAALRSVDASGMTGGGLNITTDLSQDVTFTGSAGNDRLAVTTGNINSLDKLSFGAGTDTLGLSGTNLTIASGVVTQAIADVVNAITDLERIELTSANATALKLNDFTVVNTFVLATASTTSQKLVVTGLETADTIILTANLNLATQVTGAGNTAGATAISLAGASVAQTANITLDGARTIAGQIGQANNANSATAGAGGSGIEFGGNVTKLVINSIGTSGTNAINGAAGGNETGTGSTGGAAAAAIANGTAVQQVDIIGTRNLTIAGATGGTGTATNGTDAGGFSGAVNVNASTFSGKLTITTSGGNDILTAGTGGTVFRGFGGTDSFTAGSGVDQINLTVAADTLAANAMTVSGFTAGSDKFVIVGGTVPTAIKSGSTYTAAGTGTLATDIASAVTAGGGLGANNNVAIVTITGTGAGTYLVVDNNGNGTYNNANDAVVKLVGLSGTLSTTDFASAIA